MEERGGGRERGRKIEREGEKERNRGRWGREGSKGGRKGRKRRGGRGKMKGRCKDKID